MKKLLLALIAVAFFGCEHRTHEEVERDRRNHLKEKSLDRFEESEFVVIEIDGCEYLYHYAQKYKGGMESITHKGNCKNH